MFPLVTNVLCLFELTGVDFERTIATYMKDGKNKQLTATLSLRNIPETVAMFRVYNNRRLVCLTSDLAFAVDAYNNVEEYYNDRAI